MTLVSRLKALERTQAPRQSDGQARQRLSEHLDGISGRLRGGPLEDSPSASVAERIALAWERGDGAFARTLLMKAAGRKEASDA